MRVSQILRVRKIAHFGLEGYQYQVRHIPRSWVSKVLQKPTPEEQLEVETQNKISKSPPHSYYYLNLTLNNARHEANRGTPMKLLAGDITIAFDRERIGLAETDDSQDLALANEPTVTVSLSVENMRKAIQKCDHYMVIYLFECLDEHERSKLSVEELLQILPSYNPVFYLRHSSLVTHQELGGLFPTVIWNRLEAKRVFFGRFQTFLNHFRKRKAEFPTKTIRYLFHLAWATGNRDYADKLWDKHREEENLDILSLRSYLNLIVRSRPGNDVRTWRAKLRHQSSMSAILLKVENVLEHCNRKNVVLDSNLIGPTMLAYARLGRMRDVEAVMEKAWGISIPKILAGKELVPMSMLDTKGPLHPVSDFFLCLINAYGSNYSVPRLLPILDFFLKPFKQTLNANCAELLLEYAYKARWKGVRQKLATPNNLVEDVYRFLLDHNVKPTLTMYDLRFREIMHQQRIGSGIPMLREYLEEFGVFIRMSVDELYEMKKGGKEVFSFKEMRESDLNYQKTRHSAMFRRWIEIYCMTGSRSLSRGVPGFARKTIPDVVEEWGEYLGSTLAYETDTGFCQLHVMAENKYPKYSVTRTTNRYSRRTEKFPEWAYGADKDWYDES